MRGMDIRVLCPPRARPPHGHAAPGMGSSRFSASLVILPALHEPSLDDSNGDADSKVYAHPPCPTDDAAQLTPFYTHHYLPHGIQ